MKPRINAGILIALLSLVFTAQLRAQLPNAWQINDNTSSFGVVEYLTNLTPAQVSAADTDGWRYDVVSRLVSGSGTGAQGMAFYADGRRFYVFLTLDGSGQLTAQLVGGGTYTVADAADATKYHTYELYYNPVAGSNATFFVDGTLIASWPGQSFTGLSDQVMWGANGQLSTGVMNYHHVEFGIGGLGIVASYNAGWAGNPAVAPSPTSQGWMRVTNGLALPEGAVSPDTVALPLATTQPASEVQTNSATLNALFQFDGLPATYYFEYGVTTNYDRVTITNTQVADFYAFSLGITVGGLSPGTTYHFRVVASNRVGQVVGQDMSFVTAPLLVTSLADSGPGTLRSAVAFANTNAGGAGIAFDPALAGQTIVLTNGELLLTNAVSIDASNLPGGITISGNHSSRIFEINFNANVVLNSLTLTGGHLSSASGFAEDGGCIFVSEGTLVLNDCTVSGNFAAGDGGGIWSDAILTVNRCTVSDNSSSGDAGGIENSGGTFSLNDSTLFGNSANYGGGLDLYGGVNAINNSTLSGNSVHFDGSGIFHEYNPLWLTNTIVAGNAPASSANILGTFSGVNDLTNGDPLLAPPGNYGGPTQTMPPLAGSPAIDAGADSVTSFLTTDQRGYPRKSGAHVDIGAVEAQYAPANNAPHLMNAASSSTGGNNSFQFTFSNVTNADFTVLATTNLALPLADWIEVGNAAQNPPGQYQFTDPGATNYPQRFYQVVSP
jgi:Vibrio cholerae sialidase, lectin insertion